MRLIRWDPFDDLALERESTERLFENFFTRRPLGQVLMAWQPAVEIFETGGEVVVRAELPGIDPKNVDIKVGDHDLTIKGETKTEHEEKGRSYYRRELRYGSFTRTLALPDEVEAGQAKATYKNGILEIRMPKSVLAKVKQVKVEIAEEKAEKPEPVLAR